MPDENRPQPGQAVDLYVGEQNTWARGRRYKEGGTSMLYESWVHSEAEAERDPSFPLKQLEQKDYLIKIFDPQFTPSEIASWRSRLRAYEAIQGAEGPYINKLVDWGIRAEGSQGRELFVVLERINGITVDEAIERRTISPGAACRIVGQIASAAARLASLGFVHRDIKPENVLIKKDLSRAYLVDLGTLLRLREPGPPDRTVDATRDFLGTHRYAPPEALGERAADLADDYNSWRLVTVYQLGALAYELLRGEKIFKKKNDEDLIEAIKSEAPEIIDPKELLEKDEGPADIEPEELGRVVSLVNSSLSKDPADRKGCSLFGFVPKRRRRIPTIVLVYSGGTISSEDIATEGGAERDHVSIEKAEDTRLTDISRRLLEFYGDVYGDFYRDEFGRSVHGDLDIQWKIVEPEHQGLSENFTSIHWNAINRCVESVASVSENQCAERYILGVIVLHGTDTMAYSAAASMQGLPDLPFSVVFTGSNNPLRISDIHNSNVQTSNSDAWRNLLLSMHFLYSIGHLTTEVYIAFNSKVHHTVNVKKVRGDYTMAASEPYAYANVGLGRTSAFESIDGIFVNNLYPIAGSIQFSTIRKASSQYSHLREHISVREHETDRVKEGRARAELAAGVMEVTAAPTSFPPRDLEGVRIVVIEGLLSGTFRTVVVPDTEGQHPKDFYGRWLQFLLELTKKGIPAVLVSEEGLSPTQDIYHRVPIENTNVQVITLATLVKETAVPLLSAVLGFIDGNSELSDQWGKRHEGGAKRFKKRTSILRKTIRTWQVGRQDLMFHLLGDLTNPRDQREKLDQVVVMDRGAHKKVRTSLLPTDPVQRARNVETEPESSRRKHDPSREAESSQSECRKDEDQRFAEILAAVRDTSIAALNVAHLNYMIYRFHEADSIRGNGIASFGTVAQLGWDFAEFFLQRFPQLGGNYHALGHEERLQRLRDLRDPLKVLDARLSDTNIVNLHASELQLVDRFDRVHDPRLERSVVHRICIRISAKRVAFAERDDELYSIENDSDANREFLLLLARGVPLSVADLREGRVHGSACKLTRDALRSKLWKTPSTPILWFLIGYYKRFVLYAARTLGLDDWVGSYAPGQAAEWCIKRSVDFAALPDVGSHTFQLSYRNRNENRFQDSAPNYPQRPSSAWLKRAFRDQEDEPTENERPS